MSTPLATITNHEDGMTAFVHANHKTGFNVTLRDDDSGHFLDSSIVQIPTLDDAINRARNIVHGRPSDLVTIIL